MKKFDDLKPDWKDRVHTGAQLIFSEIPAVGGLVTEVFNEIVTPSLERRRNEWLNDLMEKVVRLEQKVEGFKIDSLAENDQFLTCLLEATQIALRTHQKMKLECLRNAVINTAIMESIDDDKINMYLHLVQVFGQNHLKLLLLLKDPRHFFQNQGITPPSFLSGSPLNLIEIAYPDLKEEKEYLNKIILDLYQNGLINTQSLSTTMTESGMYSSRTTNFGNDFLSFISSNI